MESFYRLFYPSEFLGTPTPFPLVTNWFSANVIALLPSNDIQKKRTVFLFFFLFHLFLSRKFPILISFTRKMIIIQNYNSKHVSPLFQGFLSNDIQKKERFLFFFLFHLSLSWKFSILISFTRRMINYNSKHVSPLFQGFLNDHFARLQTWRINRVWGWEGEKTVDGAPHYS